MEDSPAKKEGLESELSRGDVKAQREAKKSAKAARKSKDLKILTSPKLPEVKTTQPNTPKQKTAETSSPSTPKLNLSQKAHETDSKLSHTEEMSQKDSPAESPNPQSELSREDVKSQREAKKAAKAARKSKGVEGTENLTTPKLPETKTPQPITPKQKTTQVWSPSTPQSKTAKTPRKINGADGPESIGSPKLLEVKTPQPNTPKQNKEDQPTSSSTPQPTLFQWGIEITDGEQETDLEFSDVEPMFQELGSKYSNNIIRGSNQRTIELLKVVKAYVKDYRTPEGKGFKQDISTKLQHYIKKLKLYRPFAVGMTSAVDGLNAAISRLDEDWSDENYKEFLDEWCDTFIEEKIEKSGDAIAETGCEKLEDGDTILLFSLTDAIYAVFKLAGEAKKKYNIILAITNSKTYLNDYKRLKESIGSEMFQNNVRVSIINLSSIMSIISSVNKVFLGGHALFTTGGVMAHAGSSTIALCATQHNIPVLFFCETYKFCDKSPTDAFYKDVFSENKLCVVSHQDNDEIGLDSSFYSPGKQKSEVVTARIRYDVTPVHLVTCVITDIDMLPSSSVPVVLRVQESRSIPHNN